MQNISHGATQDNLSLDKLLSFDFLTPPLPIQRRIAGILSAYDELIENSQRRIRILETMARTLYRNGIKLSIIDKPAWAAAPRQPDAFAQSSCLV